MIMTAWPWLDPAHRPATAGDAVPLVEGVDPLVEDPLGASNDRAAAVPRIVVPHAVVPHSVPEPGRAPCRLQRHLIQVQSSFDVHSRGYSTDLVRSLKEGGLAPG